MIRSEENLGGAGGFHLGVEAAYDAGFDRIWLMDDDVVPAPDCLAVLMAIDEARLMAVREDLEGRLVREGRDPLRPAQPAGDPAQARQRRDDATAPARRCRERVEIENVAFEGFMVHRRVVDAVGLPDPGFFIFYDDVDFALRARRAGFPIWAVRDAVLVRQLDFDQQHALDSWKGFYMYRNLFVVHFRYGENALVRRKPYADRAGVVRAAPAARRPRRGRQRDPRHPRRSAACAAGTRSAARPSLDSTAALNTVRRLTRVRTQEPCPTCPTSSSSAPGSSA